MAGLNSGRFKRMKKIFLLLLLLSAVSSAKNTYQDWRRLCPIELDSIPARGIAEIALPPEVLGGTRPEFTDLRLVTEDGKEIEYAVRTSRENPAAVQPRQAYQTSIPDTHETVITLDLGFRNLSLQTLKLQFREPNFSRRVTINGSRRGGPYYRTPGDRPFDRRSGERGLATRPFIPDQPWTTSRPFPASQPFGNMGWEKIASGIVSRRTHGTTVDESLEFDLKGTSARRLQIHIADGKDKPLTLAGAELTRARTYLAFVPQKDQKRYVLYFGNRTVQEAPKYEFVRSVDRLRTEGVYQPRVGQVAFNPDHMSSRPIGAWGGQQTDSFNLILLIVLIAALVVIGILALRQTGGFHISIDSSDSEPTDTGPY